MKYVFIRLGIVAAIALGLLLFLPFSPIYVLKNPSVIDGKNVYEWMALTNNPDVEQSRLAIRAIGNLGPDGEPALQDLSKLMLTSPEVGVRKEAAHSLQKMFPVSVKVVDSFAKALSDKERIVRMHALLGLMKLEKQSLPALPAMLIAVKDPDNKERAEGFTTTLQETMLVAIGRASADTNDGLPVLMEFFNQTGDANLRYAAMRGLASVGTPAKAAGPEIMKILKDPKSPNELRQEAFDALERIGTPAAKSDLVFAPLGPAINPNAKGKGGMGKGDMGKNAPENGKQGDAPAPKEGGESKKGPESEKGSEKGDTKKN